MGTEGRASVADLHSGLRAARMSVQWGQRAGLSVDFPLPTYLLFIDCLFALPIAKPLQD